MRTFQTRIDLLGHGESLLSEYSGLYGKIERTLFSETIAKQIKPETIKNTYLKRFLITSRQFNAIYRNLNGKCAAIKERRKGLITESKQRISKLEKFINRLESKVKRAPNATDIKKRTFTLHQKKRRLASLTNKHHRMSSDHENKIVRLCFGSKKLFHAQYNLESNGYENHQEWKKDWEFSRSNQFYVLGSKDETAGCQGCVAIKTDNGFLLRLRLPEALNTNEKYLKIPVNFKYGADVIADALINKRAISYRFLKDRKGWRIFVSTRAIEVKQSSDVKLGAVGVDINADHLAVNEIDRFGNPIHSLRIPLVTYGLSSDQAKAIIGDSVKVLITYAKEKNKPIVIEDLSFSKKKSELGKEDKKYSRMLSSFSYEKIRGFIECRANDNGLEVMAINPAYTSVIGKFKFAKRYGITTHQAAACVIARRCLGFSERANRHDQLAFLLPVRNRKRHVFSHWASISRSKTVLAALRSLSLRQSLQPPAMVAA